jgi:hypothetical protein
MKGSAVGIFVALALATVTITGCSAGGARPAPESLSTTFASTAALDVRVSSSVASSAQENQRSAIPPALRARWKIGVHPAWMKTGGDAIFDDGYTYVGQEFGSAINQYNSYNPHNLTPRCTIPMNYSPLAGCGKTSQFGLGGTGIVGYNYGKSPRIFLR